MSLTQIDPCYLVVKLILRPFNTGNLAEPEAAFVAENARKHANVLWLNLVAIVLVAFGLGNASDEAIGQIINALIAPVMVMGAAWFGISFGGVPRQLMNIAMLITFWMFTAFSISLTTMFVAVVYSVHPIMWPVFIIVYVGALTSCILYDTTDGLKVGLDEAVLLHSRYGIAHYRKEGVNLDES